METILAIAMQKIEAKRTLDYLAEHNFTGQVAGGAPRDWYFQQTAKDIDVFVETSNLGRLLEILVDKYTTVSKIDADCPPKKRKKTEMDYMFVDSGEDYYDSPHITAVYEVTNENHIIQFIVINTTVNEMVDRHFNSSIQKVVYDGNVSFFHQDFMESVMTRTITHSSEKHKDKFADKKQRLHHLADFKDLTDG